MPELQGWADLPEGLLHSTISLLSSFLDILAFAGTCCSWRAAFASYPSKSTLRELVPPLLIRPNIELCVPHLPSRSGGLKLRTCHVIDPANPKISLHCQILRVELQKWKFVGVSYGHLICGCHRNCSVIDVFTGAKVSPPELPFSEGTDLYYGMLTAPLSSPGSHLLVLAQSNILTGQLSLFDWPVGSNSWTELHLGNTRIEQIVDLNGQFIAMDGDQRLYILHLAPHLRLQELETIWCLGECPLIMARLLACGDILLMIGDELDPFEPPYYKSYQLYHLNMSTKPSRWVKMRKLENYALFFGCDMRSPSFFCISPGRWGGWSNCLYRSNNNQPWILHGLGYEKVPACAWDPPGNCNLPTRNSSSEPPALWMYPSMFY